MGTGSDHGNTRVRRHTVPFHVSIVCSSKYREVATDDESGRRQPYGYHPAYLKIYPHDRKRLHYGQTPRRTCMIELQVFSKPAFVGRVGVRVV